MTCFVRVFDLCVCVRVRSRALTEDSDLVEYFRHAADTGDVMAQMAMGNLAFFGTHGVCVCVGAACFVWVIYVFV